MGLGPWIRAGFALPMLAGLIACAPMVPPPQEPASVATRVPAPNPMPGPMERSQESANAARYYANIERRHLARGMMRTDGGGIDTRFGPDDLARNFNRIALFNEYVQVQGRFVQRQSADRLRRWQAPVRMKLHFGPSATPETRAKDTRTVRDYAKRLARLSGHPISLVSEGEEANFDIFVVSLDEQRALGPAIRAAEPSLSKQVVHEITTLERHNYCAVYASSRAANPHTYVSAVALIRTEHSDLMRLACYHEELAQALGLANDSPTARPSIFNDDEEFALLTEHDEYLIRMLYDRRLRPGMAASEAAPIIARLAEEYLGGGS